MADKLYVNKPGGVIVHLKDGTAESLAYGDRTDKHGPLADYVDETKFADPNPRMIDQQVVDAHTRAALAENGQVNSSSSAVPGNYNELDEDAAAQLVRNLERYPHAQAEVVLHEIVNKGSRQKVLDAASEFAVVTAHARIEAARSEGVEEPTRPGSDPTLTGDTGDPLLRPDDPAQSERIAERALRRHGKSGRSTPAPSSTQRSDTAIKEDGLSPEEQQQLDQRRGDPDPDGGDATSWEAQTEEGGNVWTVKKLDAYAEQHEIEDYPKSGNRDSKIEALQKAGHESPETPPSD